MDRSRRAACARRLAAALVYGKVRAALGIRQGVVSGGGSLAPHLDDFYEAIGLPVINGWGLTVRDDHFRALCCGCACACITSVRSQPCLAWLVDRFMPLVFLQILLPI